MAKKSTCLWGLLLLISGCAHEASHKNSDILQAEATLQPISEKKFLLKYYFSEPVRAIRFENDWNAFREATWHLKTPQASWFKSKDNVEIVKFSVPSRELEILIDVYNGETKNYFDPFLVFEKDGYALHLGHFKTFLVDSVAADEWKVGGPSSKKIIYRFSVVPGFFRTAVHEGKEHSLPLELSAFLNRDDIDAYVYFGSLKPTQAGAAALLADRSLPSWVYKLILKQVKIALDLYTKLFHHQPQMTPNLILNWNRNGYREGILGTTYDGNGTRTMFFTLMNKKAEPTDRALELKLLKLVYHELGHFWNINKEGDSLKIGWMIEGGNEAVMWRSMRMAKVVSTREFQAARAEHYQKCKEKYHSGMALSNLGKRDDYSVAYACGFLVGELTERLLSDRDLIHFWRELFEIKRKRGDKYSIDEYFDLLEEKSDEKAEVRALRKWIENPAEKPGEELDRLLGNTKHRKTVGSR